MTLRWGIGRVALGAAVAAGTALVAPAAMAAPFSSLTVFGDSLTDTGNAQLGAQALGLPSPTPAAIGYADGRFSNGPVWVDTLSERIGTGAVVPRLAGGTNYSVGGARAVTNADASPDLAAQIGAFAGDIAFTGKPADPTGLYVLNIGGNDARSIRAANLDAPDPFAVAAAVAAGVSALNQLGARSILVAGIPDVGLQPEANGGEAAGQAISVLLNTALGGALDQLSLLPGSSLYRLDFLGLTDAIAANPASFGFTQSIDTPCLAAPGAAPACAGFLFFDAIHPTTAAHQLIGAAAGSLVSVPEPASVALFGLGLLALAGCRRRAA
ncbi:PEP-CTERM sorting domain-containing protein [Roseomonas nepalensis]|uniref:PEP-CTERM sorting domain-containing protein n=1 Tax=Muricoccus nepalensis TaxID=1854500 RepID=A0A502GGZ6_9PROT|nr:SGNH/GDSL hydrolase family protein [Roseomonas nepalensis]TPG61144.1 PEP-CTERM sorting domain-containing protein [Roseomonas nepalensis]